MNGGFVGNPETGAAPARLDFKEEITNVPEGEIVLQVNDKKYFVSRKEALTIISQLSGQMLMKEGE